MLRKFKRNRIPFLRKRKKKEICVSLNQFQLYPELWCLIFKDLLPIDIINLRLTCKLFNNICKESDYFKSCWKYKDYYNTLLGNNIDDDIYTLYCSTLKKTFDPRVCMKEDVVDNTKLLIASARYGDFQLFIKQLENLSFESDLPKESSQLKMNGRTCAIECCIRSGNLDLIKYAINNCDLPNHWIFWEYVMIEAIDTNNLEIIEYVRDFIDDSNKMMLAFIQCALKNDLFLGQILLEDYYSITRHIPVDFVEIVGYFVDSLTKINV